MLSVSTRFPCYTNLLTILRNPQYCFLMCMKVSPKRIQWVYPRFSSQPIYKLGRQVFFNAGKINLVHNFCLFTPKTIPSVINGTPSSIRVYWRESSGFVIRLRVIGFLRYSPGVMLKVSLKVREKCS